MNGRIALCLLACCVGFIACAPIEMDPTIKPSPPPTQRELDRSVVYALILQANKDYVSEFNRVTQGDILLKRISRVATTCTACLWPIASDGIVRVPFILNSAGYSISNLALIRNAMEEYETLTCARFVSRTTESNYLNIISLGGCFSFVGRTGGAQILQLYSSSCMRRGIIQHELQHALGFYHEISRSDKDSYIIIRNEFINPENLTNFYRVEGNTLGLPYDYNSVMHYDRYAFTTNDSEPTIVPTPDPNVPVGQRYGLSDLDVQKINKLYKCNVCSTLLNEESGNFSSTSFATEYPNNMICVWLIRVPNGQFNNLEGPPETEYVRGVKLNFIASRMSIMVALKGPVVSVALAFKYFDIQHTAGCVADYIRIYDGPTRNYPLLLDRACGTVQNATIISSTEQMLIEFVSDGSVPSAGFKASYTTVLI